MVLLSKRFTAVGIGTLALVIVLAGGSTGKAEPGASWLVNGAKVSAFLKPLVQVQQIEGVEPALRSSYIVGGALVEDRCNKLELIEFALLSSGSSTGKIRFTGCKIFVKGKAFPCPPENKGEAGVIETTQLNALIVLHKLKEGGTDSLVRVEPSEKGKFLAHISVSEECAFGNGSFYGVVYLQDHTGALGTEAQAHLFEEGPLSQVYFDETDPVTLQGQVVLGLGGAHAKLRWSGLPG